MKVTERGPGGIEDEATRPASPSIPGALVVPFVLVLLINSVAVAYGFRKLDAFAERLSWTISTTVSEAAGIVARDIRSPDRNGQILVEVFSDFACQFCRESVSAIESAMNRFGDRVTWERHTLFQHPSADPLSLYAALTEICTSDSTGPWSFYLAFGDTVTWSKEGIGRVVAGLGHSIDEVEDCVAMEETLGKAWSTTFHAAALGVVITPTVIVNGIKVEGKLSSQPLIDLIDSQLWEPSPEGGPPVSGNGVG